MNRLRGKRKEKRDAAIRQFEYEYPHLSESEIGGKFGVSQSVVSRALNPPVLPESPLDKLARERFITLPPGTRIIVPQIAEITTGDLMEKLLREENVSG